MMALVPSPLSFPFATRPQAEDAPGFSSVSEINPPCDAARSLCIGQL